VGLGLLQSADKYLPKPGSVREYHPSEYIFPIILMLNGGGRSLEETRQIRMNEGLREILPLKSIPSSDAFGDWLRNIDATGGPCGPVCIKTISGFADSGSSRQMDVIGVTIEIP